jgi:hypothetical protein
MERLRRSGGREEEEGCQYVRLKAELIRRVSQGMLEKRPG